MLTYAYLYTKALLNDVFANEEGQGLAEYGLILALIAVVCIAALAALGGTLNDFLGQVEAGMSGTP